MNRKLRLALVMILFGVGYNLCSLAMDEAETKSNDLITNSTKRRQCPSLVNLCSQFIADSIIENSYSFDFNQLTEYAENNIKKFLLSNLKIWNILKDHISFIELKHDTHIFSASISSDNRLIVTGSRDKTASIWDVETGQCLHTFVSPDSNIYAISTSGDNKLIVAGSTRDKTVKIWDIVTGQCLRTFFGHKD